MSTTYQPQDDALEPEAETDAAVEDPGALAAELEPDEEPQPARGGSMLPVVVSMVAGLLVVGLLAAMMFSPRRGDTGATGAAGGPATALTIAGGQTNPGAVTGPRIGALAPDFTLTRLDGTPVQLSSYRGVKPVWVNFWATWCPPCRNEMPEMQKLYPTWKDKGVEILGVDVQEAPAKVKDFITQAGYGWNFAVDGDGKVSRQYYVSGIPTHIFVGKDGIIKDLVVSGLDSNKMVAELNQLIQP